MASLNSHELVYSHDYIFPSDVSEFPISSTIIKNYSPSCDVASDHAPVINSMINTATGLLGEESLVPLFDNFDLDHHRNVSLAEPYDHHRDHDYLLSYGPQCGIPDMAVPALIPPRRLINKVANLYGAAYNNAAATPDVIHSAYQTLERSVQGDEWFRFVPNMEPVNYPLAKQNLGFHECNQHPAIEEPNVKVGRYSEEERKERILRYLKKRNQRNFNKTIKYACRKTLADRRVRVRGRFARNSEFCDQETLFAQQNDMTCPAAIDDHNGRELYNFDALQIIKQDEEEWLQEMASLMYIPYILQADPN